MESHRQLIELATAAGKERFSAQTAFLHSGDAIPIVDNFLFALALLRQRTQESVGEAKELLGRLLPFQTPEGTFPGNIHEYPTGNPRLTGPLLPCFYWILRGYRSVLGKDLVAALEEAAKRVVEAAAPTSLKGQAAAYALGLISRAPEEPEVEGVGALGEAFVAEQILGVTWNGVRQHLKDHLHHSTALYAGPPIREQQLGVEPAVTLLDLQIAALTGHFSQRILKPQRVHLQGALVHPFAEGMELTEGSPWAYGVAEGFRLVWGDAKVVRTLLIPEVNGVERKGEQLALRVEEPRLYLPLIDGLEITVGGEKATCFSLGDQVEVRDGEREFTLRFDGEGRITGHIHRGNRPGQLLAKEDGRFDAYDWKIFLRGEGEVTLTMELKGE